MSWTIIKLEVHVDGGRDPEVAADLLELLADDSRVIASMAQLGATHEDRCDDDPCICESAA